MKKKFLAVAMAAVMAFSVAPALPVNSTVAEAAEAQTLTSEAWWSGTGVSSDYALDGNGSVTLDVDFTAAAADGSGAFSVEIYDGTGFFLTTGSDKNAWYAESAEGDAIEGIADPLLSDIVEGHKYQVVVERSGADFTIAYNDVTDNTEYCKLVAKNTNMPENVKVHFMAQLGTYTVSSSAEAQEPEATPVPTEAPQTGGESPATDFSAVSVQPDVKYTFESADEVTLFGDAEVKDGVLNLAKDATSSSTTYVQIADLSSLDFSKGITLTADVKVDAYASDWTPIFMLGDGTIGGGDEGVSAVYHFTQGFSSVGGVTGNFFEGYFGNAISAPYSWDFFNNEANRGKWYTLSVTISPTTMTTYVNGQQVQTAEADYTNILTALKSAKNNYLGASYWPADPDFAGSLANVAIYTTALSAEDMGKLSAGPKTDIGENGGSTTPNGTQKQIMISGITAKCGTKKVSGTVNAPNATVTVKVNKKAAVKATVKDKKFSATLKSKLKGGDKVVITVTADGYYDKSQTVNVKDTSLKVKKVTAKKNAKTITGTVTVKKATVKVKVGKKAYKKAKVSGKNFTFKTAKLKKGTKVVVKATKKNFKTATKTVTVK